MIAAVRRFIALLKGPHRKVALRYASPSLDGLMRALRSNRVDQAAQQIASQLSVLERWVLLARVLEEAPHSVVHFVHVPKTGGTTLAAALSADARFLVVSVDGRAELFIKQLRKLRNDATGRVVFVRAHHGLSLAVQSGANELLSVGLTTLRAPEAIHASNANMIVRRIRKLVANKAQSAEDAEYASRWLAVMQGRHENSLQFALEILSTPEYRAEMGGVYAKMFDIPGWREALRDGKLLCFDKDDLDGLFSTAFGYSQPPSRRNVSNDGPLHADQIPSPLLRSLVESDQEIYEYLSVHRADPTASAVRLRTLLEERSSA